MTQASLASTLTEYCAAMFPGLWIESYEQEEACKEIQQLCEDLGWVYYQWDCVNGLAKMDFDDSGRRRLLRYTLTARSPEDLQEEAEATGAQPRFPFELTPLPPNTPPLLEFGRVVQALQIMNMEQGRPICVENEDGDMEAVLAVLVIRNIHGFLNGPVVSQLLQNILWEARAERQFLIGISHKSDIPAELEKVFQVIEHPLPDGPQLLDIAQGMVSDASEFPADHHDEVIDAAKGLTRLEAEGAFALSLVREERILPRPVFEVKSNMLRKGTGALTLYQGTETFDDIGGFSHLKEFCLDSLSHREENPRFRPKGVMLMGVSGGGKSLFAKALGTEVGRPTLICDVGAVMGRYVGQSESNMRQMLKMADAMAPCVLFLDEVEKSLAGASGDGDSGVKAGVFGALLTWMNDHRSDVYMIVTCNDITRLTASNPEFARQGRFDGLFFVDFPDRESKDAIWEIHLKNYGFLPDDEEVTLEDLDQPLPLDNDMTGAEIEAICRLARLRRKPLQQIGRFMPKIIDQAFETIERTRDWASNRCWSAEHAKLYRKQDTRSSEGGLSYSNGAPKRRNVTRKAARKKPT